MPDFLSLPLVERVRSALPEGEAIYLVGGAVRDALLGRSTHDLDLALPGNAIAASRQVADALKAAFYPLDAERDVGRVMFMEADGSRFVLDFAALRGPDLDSDLRARDFTINAMAVNLIDPGKLLDPLGGAQDLRNGQLRLCSPTAFLDDPLRILRCVRQAAAFNFQILPETRNLLRQALPNLTGVSAERLRDEIFRMLDDPGLAAALRTLDILGVIPYILPELHELKGIAQPLPHTEDVFSHTISVAQKLDGLLNFLSHEYNPESGDNWGMGLVSLRLGRYRQQISNHFGEALNPNRSVRALLLLAALYHDIAKPLTQQSRPDGRIRFLEHEQVGAQIAGRRANALHLSNLEIERLKVVVRNHMRPLLLAQSVDPPTARAVYRFFRATNQAGVDVVLLSLADTLATYGAALPQEVWARQLDVARSLLEAWWERPEENVSPPALLNGSDLIQQFHLQPGPDIGKLLEALREAQAAGEVHDRTEAIEYAQAWLQENPHG